MNTNPVPFPQGEAPQDELCMMAWLQDAKGEGWVGGKENQAGVAASLAHGAAISQWVPQEAPQGVNDTVSGWKASEKEVGLQAIKHNRGNQFLPIFWSNNCNSHRPYPGVC